MTVQQRNYVPTVADEDGTGIDTTLESTVIDEDENKIVQVYTFVMPEKKVTITERVTVIVQLH